MFDPVQGRTSTDPEPHQVDTKPRSSQPPPTPQRRLVPIAVLSGLILGLGASVYLLFPLRTNVLILGSDRRPADSNAARTDTIILTTFLPLRPYVGLLSIPRDLWVEIPGQGPNRINAAYFLAETAQPGSGAKAATETVRRNFGVDVHSYISLDFKGFVGFIDGLGGVDVDLAESAGGYQAGRHHLDGAAALAFVRDRKGSDDFFRMARAQLLLRALLRRLANPAVWPRGPVAVAGLLGSLRTDVPLWEWPRLAFVLLRVGPGGIDGRVLGRDMAQGFTTNAGAQVLAPDWPRINPVLLEMFGQ